MKFLRILMIMTAMAAFVSPLLRADVYETNNTPCTTKIVMVKQYTFQNGWLISCPTWEAPVAYGATLSITDYTYSYYIPDQWGYPQYQSYEVRFESQYSYHVAAPCGAAVVDITGLPEVVCLGEQYEVTAQSSGGTLTALQWSGDAQIVSQFGHSAIVRFNAFGSNKTLIAKNNVGSSPPQVTKKTDVPQIEYSIPARNGDGNLPRSIPYNTNTTVTVTITGTNKLLKFKIVGGNDNNGKAVFVGGNSLSGSGNLVIKGTTQTVPGYAGQLSIRTDTKPGSECGPSDGFSVCAHPAANEIFTAAPVYNPSKGLVVNHRWISDSGDRAHLNEVYVKEDISFLQNRQGSLQNLSGPGFTSDFIKASLVQPDVHRTAQDSILIGLFNSHGGGSYEDRQKEVFYCRRCGMQEETARPSPSAGFKVLWSIFRPAGHATRIDLKVEKVAATVGSTAPGSVVSGLTDNPTVHTLQP